MQKFFHQSHVKIISLVSSCTKQPDFYILHFTAISAVLYITKREPYKKIQDNKNRKKVIVKEIIEPILILRTN